ncbi:hypothetical protein A2382_00880 [Candidatus Woesebacteria bacterium RIFOXYB1_FULL_38_16]|uniref:Glycosyl transferase family 1 domain-containing protein n=1 Tax=Candidatus Woesebacteria bacterium RIFOXYB1_FULL_38_16 TaxID=1802538 RepID=A0A1F8CSP3_9BACT|nr:MAG: hypothetical protein A2191_00595 [Candidatus Woesebacteria bacterium RIFOXYA1_FULL_38_9]OGM79320.1 MAG: hypothetical protein A2382_00880 [Candidatus Woesebacteria bacterium RIFOXYB1_FULL_38_16]
MKVAIVYDRVNKWGGAERVLLSLHKMFPDAPLYTSVYDGEKADWARVFSRVIPSFLQNIPYAKYNHEKLALLMPIVFESFCFDHFDLVISVTSEAGKGILTSSKTKHICYCLTPTRYLWSGHGDYFRNKYLRILSQPAISYLRKWDIAASRRPDVMIAVSSVVQNRIKQYYDRDSVVVHPPVDYLNFSDSNKKKNKDYYLLVSRLVPYKRNDLAVRAFNELGLPLVVIGEGVEGQKLKKMARDNIRFISRVSDEELGTWYLGAKALIMPQSEDFGLVAVEAQAYGVPVVSYADSGVRDIVIEGETGYFFDKQEVGSIMKALKKTENMEMNPRLIKNNSKRFSFDNFTEKLLKIINND